MTQVAMQLALTPAPTVLFPGVDKVLPEGTEKDSGTNMKVYQVQRLLGLKVGSKKDVGEWSTTAQAVFEWKLENAGVRIPDRKTFLKEKAKLSEAKKDPGQGKPGEASSSSDRPMQVDDAALTRAAGDDSDGEEDHDPQDDSEDDLDGSLAQFLDWMVQNRKASKKEIRAKCLETVWHDWNTVIDVNWTDIIGGDHIQTKDGREWIDRDLHDKGS